MDAKSVGEMPLRLVDSLAASQLGVDSSLNKPICRESGRRKTIVRIMACRPSNLLPKPSISVRADSCDAPIGNAASTAASVAQNSQLSLMHIALPYQETLSSDLLLQRRALKCYAASDVPTCIPPSPKLKTALNTSGESIKCAATSESESNHTRILSSSTDVVPSPRCMDTSLSGMSVMRLLPNSLPSESEANKFLDKLTKTSMTKGTAQSYDASSVLNVGSNSKSSSVSKPSDHLCQHCQKTFVANSVLRNHIKKFHSGSDLPVSLKPGPKRKNKGLSCEETLHSATMHVEIYPSSCDIDAGSQFNIHLKQPSDSQAMLCGGVNICIDERAKVLDPRSWKKPNDCNSAAHFVCEHCGAIFVNNRLLRQHISKLHVRHKKPRSRCLARAEPEAERNSSVDSLRREIVSDKTVALPSLHACFVCSETFASNLLLKSHVLVQHPEAEIPENLSRCRRAKSQRSSLTCSICAETFLHKAALTWHTKSRHNGADLSDERIAMEFNSVADFLKWKAEEEEKSISRFVKSRRDYVDQNGVTRQTFRCHRSGPIKRRGQGMRKLKGQGSVKIGSLCPASMSTKIRPNGTVLLSYSTQHKGHQLESSHVHLTRNQREYLSRLLSVGVPFKDILDLVHQPGQSSRTNLPTSLTAKDLHNVMRDFKIPKQPRKSGNVVERQEEGVEDVVPGVNSPGESADFCFAEGEVEMSELSCLPVQPVGSLILAGLTEDVRLVAAFPEPVGAVEEIESALHEPEVVVSETLSWQPLSDHQRDKDMINEHIAFIKSAADRSSEELLAFIRDQLAHTRELLTTLSSDCVNVDYSSF